MSPDGVQFPARRADGNDTVCTGDICAGNNDAGDCADRALPCYRAAL